MRLLRTLFVFEVGAWVGMAMAAAFLKRTLPSVGSEESDEVALVAILDGVQLTNRSSAFRGGSMLAWLGGIDVDLREAELAPGATLTATALFGGISVRIPEGWRVESRAKAVAGGVQVKALGADDPGAPTLTVEGLAAFGGIAIVSKPPAA